MELNLAISARRAGFLTLTLGALIFSFAWAPQSLAQLATDDITETITSDHIKDGDVTSAKLYSGDDNNLRAASKRTLDDAGVLGAANFERVDRVDHPSDDDDTSKDGIAAIKFEDGVLSSISNDAVTKDGNIQLAVGSVTAEKIAVGAVGRRQLAVGAVDSIDIKEEAVKLGHIAEGALETLIMGEVDPDGNVMVMGVQQVRDSNADLDKRSLSNLIGGDSDNTFDPSSPPTETAYRQGSLRGAMNYLRRTVGLVGSSDSTDLTSRIDSLVARAGDRGDNARVAIETATTDMTRLAAYREASSFGQNNYWKEQVGLDLEDRFSKTGLTASEVKMRLGGASLTKNINYAVDELLGALDPATDRLANFDTKPEVLANELTQAEYRAAHAGAQLDYWALRVGLESNVDDADIKRKGNLWERSAYVRKQVGLRSHDAVDIEADAAAKVAAIATAAADAARMIAMAAGLDPDEIEAAATEAARVAVTDAVRDMARLDAYREASAHAQRKYWVERIGLNAEETATEADYDNPLLDVTLTAQINWLRQEVGQQEEVITGFDGTDSWAKALDPSAYDTATLRAQGNYWADRIGLNPNATPSRVGSIQAQTNYVKREFDSLGRGIAMASAMRDVAIPYGQDTGASFTISNHGGERSYALSLAYASGDSSKFTLSMASTSEQDDSLFRMGYDIAW